MLRESLASEDVEDNPPSGSSSGGGDLPTDAWMRDSTFTLQALHQYALADALDPGGASSYRAPPTSSIVVSAAGGVGLHRTTPSLTIAESVRAMEKASRHPIPATVGLHRRLGGAAASAGPLGDAVVPMLG